MPRNFAPLGRGGSSLVAGGTREKAHAGWNADCLGYVVKTLRAAIRLGSCARVPVCFMVPAATLPTALATRLVTYNVHGCVGGDRALSVERIACVLQEIEPDVVVLQELDVSRARSGHSHQPDRIAERLGMNVVFCATVRDGDEHYGHAILSRYEMRLVKSAPLPGMRWPRPSEPRSALWVECALPGRTLQVMGTHLGLSPWERTLQASALLGEEWMASASYAGARVLCGDFNVGASSITYRRFRARMNDAQHVGLDARARPTFPARFPLLRLDHVFVSDELGVTKAEVVLTELSRLASDHLPLVVDMR